MQNHRVLIVDDESSLRTALFRILDRKSYQVLTANSHKEALSLASGSQTIDLALVDLKLPDGNGLDTMKELKRLHPNIQTIVMTGFGTIESAVQATKLGAFHFITKPFNIYEISSLVEKALAHRQLQQENVILKSSLHQKYKFDNIVGQSPEITRVLELIEKVSNSDSTVLITGESGTGKELVARAIHFNSDRAEKSLIPVNCGAIPSELLESELFGHMKGAFTGAISNRVGRFELADHGSIFLDEIGDMSSHLQVKLLRVLQDRKFEPVGSTKTMEVDVRIIAATNIDLELAVENGKFREDLFYRLNVIPIHIPSLRERKSDIPVLIHHFMQQLSTNKGKHIEGFAQDAMEALMNYGWPGNVRELENLIERLATLKGGGIIQLSDLPSKYQQKGAAQQKTDLTEIPEDGLDFNSAVNDYENQLIIQALEKTGWNRNQAARLLRLNRTTLVEKIKKKGLAPLDEDILEV